MTLTEFLTRYQSEARAILADRQGLNRYEQRNMTANGRRRTTSKRIKRINAEASVMSSMRTILISRLGDLDEIKILARDYGVQMLADRQRRPSTAGPRLSHGQLRLFIDGKITVAEAIEILEATAR